MKTGEGKNVTVRDYHSDGIIGVSSLRQVWITPAGSKKVCEQYVQIHIFKILHSLPTDDHRFDAPPFLAHILVFDS